MIGAAVALATSLGCGSSKPNGDVHQTAQRLQASLARQAELERKLEDLTNQVADLNERPAEAAEPPPAIDAAGRRRVAIRPNADGSYRSRVIDEGEEEPWPEAPPADRPTLTIQGDRAAFREGASQVTTYRLSGSKPAVAAAPARKPLLAPTVVEREGPPPPPPPGSDDRIPVARAPVPKVADAVRASAPPAPAPAPVAVAPPAAPRPAPAAVPAPVPVPLKGGGEAVVTAPKEPAEIADVEQSYKAALELLKRGQHEQAVAGFRRILADHPRHDLADNAQYWLGEAYYDQKEYVRALGEFQRVLRDYPKGNKSPDALYKISLCHTQLQDERPAREALERLMRLYPKSEVAKKARARLAASDDPTKPPVIRR